MEEVEAKLHRTWIQWLVDTGHRELAAAVLDAELRMKRSDFGDDLGIYIDIPSSAYAFIGNQPDLERILKSSLTVVIKGRFTDQNGNEIDRDPDIKFRVKLLEVGGPLISSATLRASGRTRP